MAKNDDRLRRRHAFLIESKISRSWRWCERSSRYLFVYFLSLSFSAAIIVITEIRQKLQDLLNKSPFLLLNISPNNLNWQSVVGIDFVFRSSFSTRCAKCQITFSMCWKILKFFVLIGIVGVEYQVVGVISFFRSFYAPLSLSLFLVTDVQKIVKFCSLPPSFLFISFFLFLHTEKETMPESTFFRVFLCVFLLVSCVYMFF